MDNLIVILSSRKGDAAKVHFFVRGLERNSPILQRRTQMLFLDIWTRKMCRFSGFELFACPNRFTLRPLVYEGNRSLLDIRAPKETQILRKTRVCDVRRLAWRLGGLAHSAYTRCDGVDIIRVTKDGSGPETAWAVQCKQRANFAYC